MNIIFSYDEDEIALFEKHHEEAPQNNFSSSIFSMEQNR